MRFSSKINKSNSRRERWQHRARWAAPLGLALASGVAQGQFRASIQGSVTDNTGAAIPGATLTLTDQATNKTLTATSNQDGVYNFNALPSDHFKLTATANGFQPKTVQDLTIIPEQANSLNVQLAVTGSNTVVDVSGDTVAAVDTQTANIGATIGSNEIQHIPSFNRDVFTLSQLVPGAISDGGQSAGGGVRSNPGTQGPGGSTAGGQAPTENGPQINANGGQYQNNGIEIDGISVVSAVWGGTTIITPSEESIDNVRILTNVYDAEYGRFSGATTLITSKSGTNQIHGSAFIAIHRPGLNAYNRVPRAADGTFIGAGVRDNQRFNQYGGSIGAPIWKNKVFAFFAYESSPNNSIGQSLQYYETPQLDKLAPANSIASQFLNFPNAAPNGTLALSNFNCGIIGLKENVNCRTIPGQGLDVGSPIKGSLGQQDSTTDGTPNNPGTGGGFDGIADIAQYLANNPTTSYYRQYNGRLDGDVSKNDHLAFAIYWVPQGTVNYQGANRGYDVFNHEQINKAMSGIWNHTFGPTFLNEARANAAGWRWDEIASNPQQPVGLPQANVKYFAPGTGSDSNGNVNSIQQFGSHLGSILNQWTFGYKDVATKVAGRHTVKFGAEFTQLHYLNQPIGRPTYTFYNIWDFLNDAPYQEQGPFNSVTGLPGGVRSDQRQNMFGAFVQDSWKAAPSLTISAGLRYSYFGALYSKQNNLSSPRFGAGTSAYTGLSVPTGNLWNPQKGNVGPQFGFNWSPGNFNNKLIVRGGFGLSFNEEELAITANLGGNPPAQNNVNFAFNSPSDPGTNGRNIVYGISSSPTSLSGFAANPHAVTPYNSAGLPSNGNANIIIIGDGRGNLATTYTEHYSLDTTYEVNRELVASIGYQGSVGRHLISHTGVNAPGVVAGYALNPLVTGGDYWDNRGSSNNNAFLAELKHPMRHGVSVDAQFLWAKSMDTNGSGPYFQDPYFPLSPAYSYGPSDFNVGKSFKAYGLWQPVFFHGDKGWIEKVAGGWTLGGIVQIHNGYPYSPNYGIASSLYCANCGYTNLRPQYLGGGNGDHSNTAFIRNTNYPGYAAASAAATSQMAIINGGANPVAVSYNNSFFSIPNYASAIQSANGTGFPAPNVALPPRPGSDRNSFVGPGYRDVDASLTKGFGLPNTRLLGESAKLEIRADVFNVFNILNLNPSNVANNITSSNFGQDTSVLGGRTITFQGRFSF